MTNFLLIRHGNSEAVEFAPGRTPAVHLSASGKKQVLNLADKISRFNIDFIFSSPIDRTRETAEAIAEKLNLNVETLEGLHEVDLGEFTGKTFVELENIGTWQRYHSLRSMTRMPLGESFLEVQARMLGEIDRLRKELPKKNVIIVSHMDPIKSVLAYYLGTPVDFTLRFAIDTASVSMLSITDRTAKIHFINKWGFHSTD